MQSEQNPKLKIQKRQAVSYAHQDPMLHPDHPSLIVRTIEDSTIM